MTLYQFNYKEHFVITIQNCPLTVRTGPIVKSSSFLLSESFFIFSSRPLEDQFCKWKQIIQQIKNKEAEYFDCNLKYAKGHCKISNSFRSSLTYDSTCIHNNCHSLPVTAVDAFSFFFLILMSR